MKKIFKLSHSILSLCAVGTLTSACEPNNKLELDVLSLEPGCFQPFVPDSNQIDIQVSGDNVLSDYNISELRHWLYVQGNAEYFNRVQSLTNDSPYADEWRSDEELNFGQMTQALSAAVPTGSGLIPGATDSTSEYVSPLSYTNAWRLLSSEDKIMLAVSHEVISCTSEDEEDCYHFSNEAFVRKYSDYTEYEAGSIIIRGNENYIMGIDKDFPDGIGRAVRGCDPDTKTSFELRPIEDHRPGPVIFSPSPLPDSTGDENTHPFSPNTEAQRAAAEAARAKEVNEYNASLEAQKQQLLDLLGPSFEAKIQTSTGSWSNHSGEPNRRYLEYVCWNQQSEIVSCAGIELPRAY
jgi:hypothetical protein